MQTRRLCQFRKFVVACALAAAMPLAGCGSGGGGAADAPGPPPDPGPSRAETLAASRLAANATFGMDYVAIETMARSGSEAWLDQQFAATPNFHVPIVAELVARRDAGDFVAFEEDIELLILFRRLAWWNRTITGTDALRQRVAFALSEIFVVSDNVDALIINPYALSGYYDMLLRNSFGNFRDLLRDVSLHPAMGIYLSHVNNRKADPAGNTFPDENYAREVMQLFSIGLFELNIDGTRVLGSGGGPIPTYDNNDIREFAKIFTGLSYGGSNAFFGNPDPSFLNTMTMFDDFHEPGEKNLLNGATVPAGQGGAQDIEDAIDNLFNHPNVGPFIGRQLIQRLVTSNPSPAYVERVARAFNGDDTGVRGDLRAVIRAILLDQEATAAPDVTANFGKLREPVVRYASILRQLGASAGNEPLYATGYLIQTLARQHPLSAPSVFNFFLPAHMPAGALADAGLVAPEFEITTSSTIVGLSNFIDIVVVGDFLTDVEPPFAPATLDLQPLLDLAADIPALVDRLDVLFTYGTLDSSLKLAIELLLADIDDLDFRVKTAVYLVLISPDYAVRI